MVLATPMCDILTMYASLLICIGVSSLVRREFGQYGTDLAAVYDFFVGNRETDRQTSGLPYEYVKEALKEVQITLPLIHLSSTALINRIDTFAPPLRNRAKKILLHREDKEAKKYCKAVRQ